MFRFNNVDVYQADHQSGKTGKIRDFLKQNLNQRKIREFQVLRKNQGKIREFDFSESGKSGKKWRTCFPRFDVCIGPTF